MKAWLWLVLAVVLGTSPAFAVSESDLKAALSQRFTGDRTGACVAAGVIDNGTVATAYFCADPKSARPYDEHTAFEIGSVTKTMTAALLAELIATHDIALDDPIAKLLPPGTSVPSFNGHEITVGEIVTHTSGLPAIPPDYHPPDPKNPYAGATERDLLDTLAAIKLTREPGSKWEYSNPAMIVLSYALAKRAAKDYETLLSERLLGPLGMNETYVASRPPQVHLAQGHYPNGEAAPPWDFHPDMAGAGGVRATLADMLRYMEGELGTRDSAITPALALTQQEVADVDKHRMGMNWFLSVVNGHTIALHEGATGGYSSFAGFDRDAKRAVVLLSDTSLVTLRGLGQLGFHLLDTSRSTGAPHIAMDADAKLIDALVGKYRLQGGLGIELRHKDSGLTIQADGQNEFQMGYDSAGDFYPRKFDAVLRPRRKADGTYGFTWFQGGGAVEAKRIDPLPAATRKWMPTDTQLQDYIGLYPLTPNFGLRVFVADGGLNVQGTNQRPVKLAPVEQDIFVAEQVGAEIDFARDAGDKIVALTLKQRGQVLKGERQQGTTAAPANR
ncbi:serine hydrolase [Bradyrhizobium sp. CCGUVB4N]|uniref:serine hydrolase domain-containing protein n=1 Tax=Bradyrhizobium sp. CCGUVB4N TaxID=2949631 RepID=UPI0020B1F368|nr:serine hydrolase domain-containing protein [Bradyrhizobium sp. CCGUVB4N]MCP3385066.1 serine hydrolase [Bradyrhizobium sp. CCGUVB4N]